MGLNKKGSITDTRYFSKIMEEVDDNVTLLFSMLKIKEYAYVRRKLLHTNVTNYTHTCKVMATVGNVTRCTKVKVHRIRKTCKEDRKYKLGRAN